VARTRGVSVVRARRGFRWQGVPTLIYKPAGTGFKNIIRRVVLGNREPDLPFQVRYFEIRNGGYSSLERHAHRHAVVIIRGRGKMFLKNKVHDLKPFDAVYIGRNAVHQFHQVGREPFGFLCMVAASRDRPELVSPGMAARLRRRRRAAARFIKI